MKAFLFSALVILVGAPALGDDASDPIDPVVVSPELYEVLVENEHVRVVRYHIAPGQSDDWHTHPAKLSAITSGGSLRITTSDGESFDVVEEAGTASWMSPLGKHIAENIGETPVQVILVEVKSAADESLDEPGKD